MIKKVKIRNFESHVKTDLEFHEGINIIKGESDAGKSSIRRSLEWVALNRPSGTSFITWGKKKTTVGLDSVTKTRTKMKQAYHVGKEVYKAFRSQVPGEVQRELKLDSTNFQSQHFPYFLLSDSPGQVASTLNEVTDLGIVTKVLRLTKKKIRDTKTRIEMTKEHLDEMEKEVESLSWTEGAAHDLEFLDQVLEGKDSLIRTIFSLKDKIEEGKVLTIYAKLLPQITTDQEALDVLHTQITAGKEKVTKLSNLSERVRELQESICSVDQGDVERVDETREKIIRLKDMIRILTSLVSKVKGLENVICSVDREDVEKIDEILPMFTIRDEISQVNELVTKIREIEDGICTVDSEDRGAINGMLGLLKEVKEKEQKTLELIEKAERSWSEVEDLRDRIEEAKKRFLNLLKEVGQCPLCGRGVDEDHIHE